MKKYLCFFVMLFIFLPKVNAECSDSQIIRLQKLANNITYSYEYNESKQNFTITFTNLTKEINLKDVSMDKIYNTDKEITISNKNSGSYKFNIYAKDNKCTSDILISKYIKLPYYNSYYNSELCEGIENYSYCNKWLNNNVSYNIWYKKVTEYKESQESQKKENKYTEDMFDKISKIITDVYANYYFIILPTIIIGFSIIIYIKNKKDRLV